MHEHTCAPKVDWRKEHLATKGWLASEMTPPLREDQRIGATELSKAISAKYKLSGCLNYSKVWEARDMGLARIRGTAWEDSFQLLYAFKGEVENASLGSVVQIDDMVVRS